MTDVQRTEIEKAAYLAGGTLTGWAVSRLVGSARQEIAAAEVTMVPDDWWDEFIKLLHGPADAKTEELLARTPVWEQR